MGTACETVETVVRDAGWPGSDVVRVGLALGEAIGNAVEHASGVGEIVLRYSVRRDALTVTVSDGGPGPSPGQIESASLPSDPLATHGRGLFILRQLADSVAVLDDGSLRLGFSAQR